MQASDICAEGGPMFDITKDIDPVTTVRTSLVKTIVEAVGHAPSRTELRILGSELKIRPVPGTTRQSRQGRTSGVRTT